MHGVDHAQTNAKTTYNLFSWRNSTINTVQPTGGNPAFAAYNNYLFGASTVNNVPLIDD